MSLGDAMFIVSVWHVLGYHVPADVARHAVQMQCRSCCRSGSRDGLQERGQGDPDVP